MDASKMAPGEAVAADDFRGALLTFYSAALIGYRGESSEGAPPKGGEDLGGGARAGGACSWPKRYVGQ